MLLRRPELKMAKAFTGHLLDRFDNRVRKNEISGCWEWTGVKNVRGYGRVTLNSRMWQAHRVFYELYSGEEIPNDMQIDHLCRNRPCVNPDHLEVVTAEENVARYVGSNTHCKRGHKYDEINTKYYTTSVLCVNGLPRVVRQCMVCRRQIESFHWRKRRAIEAIHRLQDSLLTVRVRANRSGVYADLSEVTEQIQGVAATFFCQLAAAGVNPQTGISRALR
jgi:hypothetical protein